MIRRFGTVFAGAVVFAAVAAWPAASVAARSQGQSTPPTVDAIIAKNIAARGGEAKIRAIQTLKETAHVTTNGMTAPMTLYSKRPNRSRQEMVVSGKTMVAAFDGDTAWSINPLASPDPVKLTGPAAEQVRRQADFDPPLLDYKSRGTKIELVGVEVTGGAEVYHLRLTNKDGVVLQCYLDSKTGLETRIMADSPNGPVETRIGDWRDVNGLKMPFSVKTLVAGKAAGDLVVEKWEVDVPMADTLFTMPGKL